MEATFFLGKTDVIYQLVKESERKVEEFGIRLNEKFNVSKSCFESKL